MEPDTENTGSRLRIHAKYSLDTFLSHQLLFTTMQEWGSSD